MPTPTINYAFNLPTVGADDDVWGGLLNDNWTDLDAQLFNGTIGADTTGTAATATLATSATALATARTFTIGATGRTFDGSADVSWNLADIGAVAPTRSIAAGTGLTGGGDLSADRTIDADLASQAEAEAGIDNTKLMTPLRTAEAIAELVPAPAPPSTSEVLDATAGASFGAVGTYAFCYVRAAVIENDTFAGSDLFPAGVVRDSSFLSADGVSGDVGITRGPNALSGTWRAMGRNNVLASDNLVRATLFLRIS
jgi:hypothetical protein